MSVCQSVISLSFCLCMSRGTLASMVAGQLVIYISGKSVLKYLSIITQVQLKAPANVPPHWEQAILLILFCKLSLSIYTCVCARVCMLGSIGQLAGCGLQRWRWLGGSEGETAGVATIGSQVLSVTSTPPLPPTSLHPFCLHSVRGRCGICYGERLTALMHISLTATLPAVTIRKEHMPEPGTTSEELLRSHRHFFLSHTVHAKGVHLK